MRILYIDCSMGASGDMLTGALSELIADQEGFIREMNEAGIPGVHISKEPSVKCGITGTHISVSINGTDEISHMHAHEHAHEHEHTHTHTHTHAHAHASMHEIGHIISHLNLPDAVKNDITAVYTLIAEAESRAHGVPVCDIHFHEVGTADAIADIAGVCVLINRLDPDKIIVSPVCTGYGHVKCAHGILPVPAPATADILRGVPIYAGKTEHELCTPTGAALIKHFASGFGEMPLMTPEAVGYGMGNMDFDTANCVRAIIGETAGSTDSVTELSCNVDDMTAEAIGFACDRLMEAGALDVFTVPAGMKKSRPGTLICVLCKESDKHDIVRMMFSLTSTIGIRESKKERYILDRKAETLDTPFGTVRGKISYGYGVKRSKYEYDDLSRIARSNNISLADAAALLDSDR